MFENLALLLLPLIATAVSRTDPTDIADGLRWRSPTAIERPQDDSCATVRKYGYMGNVDVARIGDPCGLFTKPPARIAASAPSP